MNAARKRILNRAWRGLVSLLFGAGVTAAASDDFREFVGNEWWAALILASVPPLALAANKAWRDRSGSQS